MSATGFLDACGFFPAAGGTADFVVSSAVTGYQTPASAGAANGAVYSYRAQSSALSEWEIGFGAYASGTTTLARTTVVASSTGSKINFSAPPSVYITALSADLWKAINAREVLTANRTYYVRTDGNDSNNGLSNTSGGAFLTNQKAIDTVAGLDLSIYNVTIQVGAGTYTGGVIVNGPWIGAGTVTLVGDVTTPSNVVISTTSADAIKLQNGASLSIGGFKLQTTTSGCGILSTSGATASVVGKMEYGVCVTAHLRADGSGTNIIVTSAYAISGGSNAHYSAQMSANITASGVGTITVSGTPNFNYGFVYGEFCYVRAFGNTYSGSATGLRYNINANGVIQTAGAGESYFPGNATGTKSSGGQYI